MPWAGSGVADHPELATRVIRGRDGDRRPPKKREGPAIRAEWGELPPHWTVYFAVEDADEAAGAVVRRTDWEGSLSLVVRRDGSYTVVPR